MKTCIKYSVAILLLLLAAGCEKGEFDANGYRIIEFRDAQFQQKLLKQPGLDQNGDRKISVWELARAGHIDCENAGITHAPELKFCSDATKILFAGNSVSDELDISRLGRLVTADFRGNNISGTFNMALLSSLREINLTGNRIQQLTNVEGATALEVLIVSDNRLSGTIDLTGPGRLTELDLSGNPGIEKVVLHSRYIANPPAVLNLDPGAVVEYRNDNGEKVEP